MRVTPLSCFCNSLFSCFPLFLFSLFKQKMFLFFSFSFHCQHQYQNLTTDVSSVVGAPWRCGVLTTYGGIAGIGLGGPACLEEAMIQLPRSGAEPPRLLKRSLSRLCYCCCFGHMFTESQCSCQQATTESIVQEPSMTKNSSPSRAPKTGAQLQTSWRSAKNAEKPSKKHPNDVAATR